MAEGEVADTEPATQAGELSIVASVTDGIHVLTAAGEIDHQSGDTLRQALDVSDAPRPRVVVDLGRVTFMDSSGINVLIAAHQAHEPAGWLRLAGVRRPVLRTLEMVGLTGLIGCYPSVEAALDA